MQEKCRLCGEERFLNELFDFKSDIVQSVLQRCSIFIDENKLLPQSCCSNCLKVLENFSKFLDNINSVQDKLTDELNKQLADTSLVNESDVKQESTNDLDSPETASIFFPDQSFSSNIKTEDNWNESDVESNRIELTQTKKTKSRKLKKFTQQSSKEKVTKSWKKYSMAEIFERELKEGSNKSLAHLDVTTEDVNDDGSLTSFGIEKYGTFKWSDYVWNCVFCPTGNLQSLNNLITHCRKIHKCDPKYRCNSCCRDFVIYPAFHNHILSHNPTLKFCCFFCSKFFHDLISLYYHQENEHGTSNHFCLYCGLISKTSGKLKDHVISSHLKPEEIKDIYICDLCGKGYKTRKFVRAHIFLHLSNRKTTKDYICHQCGKSFSQKKYLYGHRLVHTSDRPYQCEFCPKNYKSKRELAQHCVSSHPGENHEYKDKKVRPKKHICDICNQAFMSEKVMIDHKNTHTGITPHLCLMCGKRFTTLKFMRLHQARHTTEKKHRCTVCDAAFKVRADLTRHSKRIHAANSN